MSWALSSLTISKFYPDLHLVTDEIGKHILIDRLNLPYSSFSLEFNEYKSIVKDEPWPMRKLFVYSLQKKPFLHVDGDIYIWKEFPKSMLNAPLVAQNIDFNLSFYLEAYRFLSSSSLQLPDELMNLREVYGSNAGIMGGNNHAFFDEIFSVAKQILLKNEDRIVSTNLDYLGTFLEQSLFFYYAKSNGIDINYLFDFIVSEENCPSLQEFSRLPNQCDFIHLMRGKSNSLLLNFLSQRIQLDHPEASDAIKDYLNESENYQISGGTNDSILGFSRTNSIISRFGYAPNRDSLIDLSVYNFDDNQLQIVKDIYLFECQRNSYEKEIIDRPFVCSDFYFRVNQYLSQSINNLGMRRVQVSSKICLIESEWPWAMEYYKMLDSERVDEILKLPSSYFLTAITELQPEGGIFEYQFDGLGILLIDELMEPITISDLCNSICTKITQNSGFKEQIIAHLKFYLYFGIIEFID